MKIMKMIIFVVLVGILVYAISQDQVLASAVLGFAVGRAF